MRLIKADDVIKSLMDMTYYDDEGHTIHDYEDRLAIVKSFIDSVPTVDAVPVRHGKWIYGENESGRDGYYCSQCGEHIRWIYGEEDIDFISSYNYCPHCGAKMDGGTNGTD